MILNVLDLRYGREKFEPGTTGRRFHDTAGQDDWRQDSTGVKYYHIYGTEAGDETITQVIATKTVVCSSSGRCTFIPSRGLIFGPGDGTVPVISARRISADDTKDYNVHAAVVERPRTGKQDHMGLTANPEVQDKILTYLLEANSAAVQSNSNGLLPPVSPADDPLPPSQEMNYFQMLNVQSIVVSDALGNSTAIDAHGVPGEVPNVDVYLDDHGAQGIIPATQAYTVTFETQ